MSQRILAPDQLAAFYHDTFVVEQVRDFTRISPLTSGKIVDIGGGCGYFARALKSSLPEIDVTVLDIDRPSIQFCERHGTAAESANALSLAPSGDERGACFNLILHHLVGPTEGETLANQRRALAAWTGAGIPIFVNEYIYDSWFGDFSARLIYEITSSKFLSAICGIVSRFVPVLRANTFGVGVRFHSRKAWIKLFESAGYDVAASTRGPEEGIGAIRLMLVRSIRRDSFLLQPASQAPRRDRVA